MVDFADNRLSHNSYLSNDNTRAVLSEGNRAMQRVFHTPNDSLLVIASGSERSRPL